AVKGVRAGFLRGSRATIVTRLDALAYWPTAWAPIRKSGRIALISSRPLGVPGPGGADDGLDVGVAGRPAEVAPEAIGGGHEDGRVAGSPGLHRGGDGMPRDAAGGIDDLEDAEAGPGADVVGEGTAGLDVLQGQDVGVGEVVDVDKIADAGAVGRRVVGPEDGNPL